MTRRQKIDKSVLAIGVPQRVEDEKHRKYIASLPCIVCKRSGHTQCAHIRAGNGGGMGYKPSDECTVPLCVSCHEDQGRNERKFWGGSTTRITALARRLYANSGDRDYAMMEIVKWKRS